MSEAQLLERIASDLDFLKTEYIRKLESIKKEGTISSANFEKKFGVRL